MSRRKKRSGKILTNTGSTKQVKLAFVEDSNKREVSFKKRKTYLFKKSFELQTLTGCEIFVVVHDKDSSRTFIYQSPSFEKYNQENPTKLLEAVERLFPQKKIDQIVIPDDGEIDNQPLLAEQSLSEGSDGESFIHQPPSPEMETIEFGTQTMDFPDLLFEDIGIGTTDEGTFVNIGTQTSHFDMDFDDED